MSFLAKLFGSTPKKPVTEDHALIVADAEFSGPIAARLAEHGWSSQAVTDEAGCLEALNAESAPAAILFCAELSTTEPFALCRSLRSHKEHKRIPMLMFSIGALQDTLGQHSLLRTRADRYVIGPDPDAIMSALYDLMTLGAARPPFAPSDTV